MRKIGLVSVAVAALVFTAQAQAAPKPKGPVAPATWMADNGDGTFTNPLFYDEFSDPDLIRVGDDFYLTGTTMHTMPGLPILHSKDLVNWTFLTYAMDKLDLGPQFRLEDGQSSYGRGIWAPSFRYHNGTYYIFSNVNGQTTQLFTAKDPKGPWTHQRMKRSFHDLSVLFDDDGKVYVVWGYREIKMAQLTPDLLDVVPGTEQIIVKGKSDLGEGAHFYKINGKYYIITAWWDGQMRMPVARADKPEGPYEINHAVSIDEDFGLAEGYRLTSRDEPYDIIPPNTEPKGRMSLHQGGIVLTPAGEWWGFSMMDYNSVGRLLGLSPVTWKDGWPYFGLPGNLGRNPRTWTKPKTKVTQAPKAVYERSDDFSGAALKPIWQWNHVPVDGKWSLSERPGYLRLHSLPGTSFWQARNSLTQRSIGPMSQPTVSLDVSGLKVGDVAGLALLNRPYGWIGVEKTAKGLAIVQYDERSQKRAVVPLAGNRIWLRADCDFMTEKAQFSYSLNGSTYLPLGDDFTMIFQGKTFQGVRYTLFNYNTTGVEGGAADFDSIDVFEPFPKGLMRPIPYGQSILLNAFNAGTGVSAANGTVASGTPTAFEVVNLKLGRVGLKSGNGFLTIGADGASRLQAGKPGTAQTFQWIETPTGELVLMSLATNRFLRIDSASGQVIADSPGPQPGGRDGVRFVWVKN